MEYVFVNTIDKRIFINLAKLDPLWNIQVVYGAHI